MRVRYVLSIKPEFRESFSPSELLEALQSMADCRVTDGAGRRTITVECSRDMAKDLALRVPEVSVREYAPLSLL